MDLSIIIPMYNASAYITKLLNSIYSQPSYDINFEVIIIDDCSIDNSVELVKQYISAHKISNIQIIRESVNSGTAAARNSGLLIASGQWVQFVDSDDYLSNNYFQTIQPYLDTEIDCYIYGFNMEYDGYNELYQPTIDIDQRMIGYRNSVVNKIYQRAILDQFEIDYEFEDVIWLVKLIGKDNYNCRVIPDLKYNVNRQNTNSKMANLKQEEWKKMAVNCIYAARELNHFAGEFVLETFVGTIFTPSYKLVNRLYVGSLAIMYHYKFLPIVVRDGIRNKSIKKRS